MVSNNIKFINDGIESLPNFFKKKLCKKFSNQDLNRIDFKIFLNQKKNFLKIINLIF